MSLESCGGNAIKKGKEATEALQELPNHLPMTPEHSPRRGMSNNASQFRAVVGMQLRKEATEALQELPNHLPMTPEHSPRRGMPRLELCITSCTTTIDNRAHYATILPQTNYMDSIVDYINICVQTNVPIHIPATLSCHYLGWIIG